MTLPTDGNAPLNNPSHLTEHQRVSDALALLVTTPWIALPFQAGWANYGAGYEQGSYRKVGDMVQLQGLIAGPSGGSNIAILPAGYRPKRTQLIATTALDLTLGYKAQRIDIDIAGVISITATAAGWVAMNFQFSTTGL